MPAPKAHGLKFMPITKSAKKALRVAGRKRLVNDRRKKAFKESIKKVERVVQDKKQDAVKQTLAAAFSAIDKAAKAGVIKKNTAARRKARLARITK